MLHDQVGLRSVSVTIPILNEVENIGTFIDRVKHLLNDFEFIFVDDGSVDGTKELLRESIEKDHRIKAIFNEKRLGHMGSYLMGFNAAESELLAIMDGDLQHPPEKLVEMSEKLNSGSDIVVGTRYHGNKFIGDRKLTRGILSRGAEIIMKTLVKECRGVSDPLSGFIGFRKGLELPVNSEMKGNKLLPFLIVSNPGAKIGYVEYQFTERTVGKSKIVGSGSHFVRKFMREVKEIRATKKTYAKK